MNKYYSYRDIENACRRDIKGFENFKYKVIDACMSMHV